MDNVKLRLGQEADTDLILNEEPDAVIIATEGGHLFLNIPA